MKKIKLFAILLLSVLAFQVQAQSETILVEYRKATPSDMTGYEFPVIPFAHDTKVAVWGGGGRGARTTKNWVECYSGGGGGGGFARYLNYSGEGWPISQYKSYGVVGEGGGVISKDIPDGGTTSFGNQYFGKIKAYGGKGGPQDSTTGANPGEGSWENGNDVNGYTLSKVLSKGGDILRTYKGGKGGTGSNVNEKSGNGGTSAGLQSSSSYNPANPFHSNYVTTHGQSGCACVSQNQFGGANHPFIGNGGQGSGDPFWSTYKPGNGDQPGGGGGASAHNHGLISTMHANGANGWAFVEFTYSVPTAPTISTSIPDVICTSASQDLTLTVENVEYWQNVQWYKDGSLIAGATGTSYTVAAGQSGNYMVKAQRRELTFDFPGATSVWFVNNPTSTNLTYFSISSKTQDYLNNGKIFKLVAYTLTAKKVTGECSSRAIKVTSATNMTPTTQPVGKVLDSFQTKVTGVSVSGDTAYVTTAARSLNLSSLFTNLAGLTMYYWKDGAAAFSSQVSLIEVGDFIEIYHVGASVSTSCYSAIRHLVITPIRSAVSIWAPGIGGGTSDNVRREWNNPNNWLKGIVPNIHSTVYIPGYFIREDECTLGIPIKNFPELSASDNAACRNIYFAFGAEIKGLQHLTVDSAYVQLNLGLQSVLQRELEDIHAVVQTTDKYDHLALSYTLSRTQNAFARDRWYMLSSPLQEAYIGDYAFGGVPATFLRKFESGSSSQSSALLGNWSDYKTASNEPLTPGEGFAYFVNPYLDQLSYNEDETMFTIKDPNVRKRQVGLAHINGVLELPYFDANTNLAAGAQEQAHRTHTYDPATRTSYFFEYSSDNVGLIFGTPSAVVRTASKSYKLNQSDIDYPVSKATGTDGKRFAMIGNPYMTTIDFAKFYADNSALIKNGYYLYTTTERNPITGEYDGMFATFNNTAGYTGPLVNTVEMEVNQYIAPMQSFIVELNTDAPTLRFKIANISANRVGLLNSLRSDKTEPNKLIVTASNEMGSVMTSIIRNNEGSSFINDMDFTKLMPGIQELPEVYTLKQEVGNAQRIGLANNFIGSEATLIPIGVASNHAGEMSVIVEGMDAFNGDVLFIDALSEMEIDITGRNQYEYKFDYTPLRNGLTNELIALENRFYLRVSNDPTAIDEIWTDSNFGVQYHLDASGLYFNSYEKMQNICIYDIQGRLVYQRSGLNTIMWNVDKALIPTVAVAQVVTDNGSYTFKLINK